MNPWSPRHSLLDPIQAEPQDHVLFLYPQIHCVTQSMPGNLQDLGVMSVILSKFPDGCCWGAPCNHKKNRNGWSSHNIGFSEESVCGSSSLLEGPRWVSQAFLAKNNTIDRLRPQEALITNRNLFLTVLEAWRATISECQCSQVLVRILFTVHSLCLLAVSSHGGRG